MTLRALFTALVALPFLILAACDGGQEIECNEEVECTGFGEVCVDSQCVVETCSSNLDCDMEHTCDGQACVPGCESDNDCYPGDFCNLDDGVCEAEGCVDTHLDCGYKEFCNTLTGECYDAGGVYCRPCDRDNVAADCNGGETSGTNECWNNFCTVDCSSGRECPSGFQCYPFTDQTGNVVTWQCLTYCWLYEDQSAPSEPVVAPPPGLELPITATCDPASLVPGPESR